MKRIFLYGVFCGVVGFAAVAVVAAVLILNRAPSVLASDAESLAPGEALALHSAERLERGRTRLALEDPRIIRRFLSGGTFGGKASRIAGQHMFSRDPAVTADIRAKTERFEIAPRTWFVRFPIVNAVFFETDEGVVVVDTGMAGAGPVLLEQIRAVTDQPIVAILFTHGHVDHMTGAWAFDEAGELPQRIIGHENIFPRLQRYGELRGSISKYMSQPEAELPMRPDDLILPTETFSDRLDIEIGGERFVLQHHRGETDDQFYVFVPGRRVLVTADYYQGFLPNLGNGKRVQRFGREWIAALRDMADLDATVLLPMHGRAIEGADQIREDLNFLADALQHIETAVIDGLNRGLRKDEIVSSLDWPETFAKDPRLATYYVTPRDIAKMYLKQWTGWWNDQPAHWNPARLPERSKLIVDLAGGIDSFLERAEKVAETDLALASHMADWAFFAEPDNDDVRAFAIDTYTTRLLDPGVTEQEALTYFDHAALVRALQLSDAE
ncbi:MAG: MBL fold metallo-hydrolase [Pseudomonadota bacterium]